MLARPLRVPPSSILGLLGRLLGLHLRRRPALAAAAPLLGLVPLLGLAALASRPGPDAAARTHQAAVLADGLALLDDAPGARRLLELDEGGVRREVALGLRAEARLVGTRVGAALAWQEGKRLRLALVDDEGALPEPSTWGRSVQRLCEGAASNDQRFGVGWLEADGNVWMVHGPSGPQALAAAAELGPEAPRAEWCGIASAADRIALLWRAKRYYVNFCDTRECAPLVTQLPLDADDVLLGFGCLRDRCLLAARDRRGAARLVLTSPRGKVQWSAPLDVAADTAVSIVGAGPRAFAVAARGVSGAAALRVDLEGRVARLWHDLDADVPSLAWSKDQLLIAYRRHGELEHRRVAFTR